MRESFGYFGIEGNAEVFEELVERLRTGKAIAFVGAGASIPQGYPTWTKAIEDLADLATNVDESQRRFWKRKAGEEPDRITKQIRDALDDGA